MEAKFDHASALLRMQLPVVDDAVSASEKELELCEMLCNKESVAKHNLATAAAYEIPERCEYVLSVRRKALALVRELYGCVLRHTVIPARGMIKGMIVEPSRRALGAAKTSPDFLSPKAEACASLEQKFLPWALARS